MNPAPASRFQSSYVFAVCNAGSEALLKAEVASLHGGLLRPAFMRPQLITWKCDRPLPADFSLGAMFARLSGVSVGRAATLAELVTLAGTVGNGKLHLHVFPREVNEDGLPPEEWARLDAIRAGWLPTLREAGIEIGDESQPEPGAAVLDVILDAGDDAPMFVGLHVHGPQSQHWPGALPRLVLPREAPSRAWLKLEQALAWAHLDAEGVLAGRVVLELGCAPGGASYALLQRGVSVFGVDTATMSREVLQFAGPHGARFVHLAMAAGDVPAALLPTHVDFIVSDMNLAPPVMLRYVERFQKHLHAKVLLLTLKLNDRAMVARIPKFIETIQTFAPAPVRMFQLPANRAELCVVAGRL